MGVSRACSNECTGGTVLELQLTDNLLALTKQFKGQPEKAAEFFTQSLLEDPPQSQATDDAAEKGA